jgi:hypothetical protein
MARQGLNRRETILSDIVEDNEIDRITIISMLISPCYQ